jgi:aminopeptidase S
MVKKLLLGAAAGALMLGSAFAANLPLLSGPIDPSSTLYTLNQLIQSINTGVNGTLAALTTAGTTSGTAINALLTYTAPGAQLSYAGQSLHAHAWGTNSADANAKTVTFSYGAATCALVVTGSGNTWSADWYLTKTGTNTQTYECSGRTSTTVVASVQGTGSVTDTAAVTVSISGTAATAGTMTLAGGFIEQLK